MVINLLGTASRRASLKIGVTLFIMIATEPEHYNVKMKNFGKNFLMEISKLMKKFKHSFKMLGLMIGSV